MITTVRNKLKLMVLVPFVLIVIIVTFVNYVYGVIEVRDKKNLWFSEANYLVNQLYMVGYDVVMYTDYERPKQQWVIISNKINESLKTTVFDNEHEVVFIESLRNRQRKISKLFSRMLHSNKMKIHTLARRQQLSRQILIQTQAIKNDIYKAIKRNDIFYNDIRDRLVLMVVGVAFLLLLVIFLSVYFLQCSIVRPLDVLKKWSDDFVKGHLDKEIELDKSNEFKLLADSFFELGWQLKQNHLDLKDASENNKAIEARNEVLLAHLENNLQGSGSGYLDWDINHGVIYLSGEAVKVLSLSSGNNKISFDQFINLIDQKDRQGVVFQLERCRDYGKMFEIDCDLMAEQGVQKKIHLRSCVLPAQNNKIVTMFIQLAD